jgi:hypothetical protein
MLLLPEGQAGEEWEPPKKEYSSEKRGDVIRKVLPVLVVTINLDKVCFAKYAVKRFVQLL